MRTTVTINDQLLAEAKVVAARTGRTLGSVIDDALRLALARPDRSAVPPQPPTLPVHGAGGLRAGVDLDDRDAIAEILGENDLRAAL